MIDNADESADSTFNFTRSLVAKPSKIPASAAEFEDCKLDFENYTSLIKPEFGDEVKAAITTGGPNEPVPDS